MRSTIKKLQKIGNSLRATMPKEAVEALSLRQGEEVVVDVVGNSAVLKRKQRAKDLLIRLLRHPARK